MFRTSISAAAIAATFLAFSTPTMTGDAQAGSVSCDVRASKRGGATVVDGYVTASPGTSGSYRISVSGAGGDTDQSGEFSGSGGRAALGSVPVAGGGNFSAEIVIKIKGVPHCSSRTSGRS